ncbi:endonuclease domain-containing 1 protein-like [Pygocentrus nattereri]|uniref:DNA/RNA non-specific endonuclease domain-containing protein n=1 Tax=Pygocentrus nattereri TaxID=42514 RepID=A0AAR2K4J7_PYGNA|nr:endonuclease domain-containing 1 protein-like [Pygocentrus nattereri]
MKLLTLLLLLGVTSLTESEVVQSFKSKCPQFFFLGHLPSAKRVATPTVLRGRKYKQICQRWKNQYRFATLYDTKSRIPVYSAYTYNSSNQFPRDKYWKVEPQLDLPWNRENSNMASESEMNASLTSTFEHQALVKDYSGDCCGKITRGHLFPKSYAADKDQGDSTFTLTNIAPQTQECNNQWAEQVEEPMLSYIKTKCTLRESFPAYIVTGVVPGNTWLEIKRGNRAIKQGVNIPTHYWTAFTCANSTGKVSHAYIAQQSHCKDNRQTKFKKLEMTVAKLEEKLKDLYNQSFSVFRNTKI